MRGRSVRETRRMRILVASAESALRDRICRSLLGDARDVERADVQDWQEAVQALDRAPDVIFCDAMLPGHERRGYQLVSEAIVLGIPIVVICPGDRPLMESKLDSLGVPRASKKKPWPREIFETIDAALRRPLH